ncbi:hypothetical protein CERZMDRAFT_100978 [Cercospora zeae-maydis SCOH1-5]|uniref:Aminoglycoside phosphotransferase domain-containing protein n=1 Tax=Cercospora zeae-maydis SCOH1-5 TaxID=717836 RepID=A0A6A6F858_9PEZI|nr:hypothetical protein CERZMDRAFT_100978 [Cercospora zeae-maydis SCOH1-5]
MTQRRGTSLWQGQLIAVLVSILNNKYVGRCFKSSGNVIFVSSRLCIKSKAGTSVSEASAMNFVRQNTSIPVPKVYFACEYKGRAYIVMQKMKGASLANTWDSRSEDSKQRVIQQLTTIVNDLRRIPVPTGIGVCNVDYGPIFDPRLPRKRHWGPFRTIRDFHLALLDGHDFTGCSSESYPQLQELASFYNWPWEQPVFTHGDLSSLNILCQGDEVVGIIDWETAGWLPPYWEYVTAWNVNPQNAFWQKEVDRFLEPLPYARQMDLIRRRYFGLF